MPKDLGELCATGCPGSVVSTRFVVTNDDLRPRAFTMAASGPAGGYVELEPAKFQVGPKERATASARLTLPATAQVGLTLESIIWIRGCHDHFVRWTVGVSARQRGACRCIEVVDRPDYVHHWYDHFYCVSGCRGTRVVDG
jgi:hypothetical protein